MAIKRGPWGAAPWWLTLPSVLACGLALVPVVYVIVRAFGGEGNDALAMIARRSTWILSVRSLALAAVVASASVVLSVALALFTVLGDIPLRRMWTVLAVGPMAVPCYVGASAYLAATSPQGVIGRIGASLGADRPLEFSGFWAAALVLTLFTYPFAYLPIRASMRRVSAAQIEASRSLGHGRLRTLVGVILPEIRPGALVGGLLVALYALGEFGAVSLLRCQTFTRAIYISYQNSFDRRGAAVLALVLVALIVVVLVLFEWLGGGRRGQDAPPHIERRARLELGAWRWLGVGVCASVGLASVGVTVGVLSWWLVRGVGSGAELRPVGSALRSTIGVSAGASLLCAAAALPIAILAARYRSALGIVCDRATHLGFALPGIIVALGMIFAVRALQPDWLFRLVRETWVVVAAAYLILYLPLAVGTIRALLERVPVRLEEAGASLGRSRFWVLMGVTLPVARPGMVAALVLVFLTATKELPATLLLAPIGTETLAIQTWQASEDARYAQAALPALVLIGLSAGVVALVVRRERMVR